MVLTRSARRAGGGRAHERDGVPDRGRRVNLAARRRRGPRRRRPRRPPTPPAGAGRIQAHTVAPDAGELRRLLPSLLSRLTRARSARALGHGFTSAGRAPPSSRTGTTREPAHVHPRVCAKPTPCRRVSAQTRWAVAGGSDGGVVDATTQCGVPGFGQLAEEGPAPAAALRVLVAGRPVGEQEVGLPLRRARQRSALPLPEGGRRRPGRPAMRARASIVGASSALARAGRCRSRRGATGGDVLEQGQLGQEADRLRERTAPWRRTARCVPA